MRMIKSGYQLILCYLALLDYPSASRCPLVSFFGNTHQPPQFNTAFLIDIIINSSIVYPDEGFETDICSISNSIPNLNDYEGRFKTDIIDAIQDVYGNPSLKHLTTLFALHQLDMSRHGISFFSAKKMERNKEISGMAEVTFPEMSCHREHGKIKTKINNTPYNCKTNQYHPDKLESGQIMVKTTNKNLIRAIFTHEATHIVLSRLYNNYADPYPKTFFSTSGRDLYMELMLNVTTNLFNTYIGMSLEYIPALPAEQLLFLINKLDRYAKSNLENMLNPEMYFLYFWCSAFLNYSASNHAAESIVQLPELLAFFNMTLEQLPQRLTHAIQPLIAYWKIINQTLEALVHDPASDINDPVEAFKQYQSQLSEEQSEETPFRVAPCW